MSISGIAGSLFSGFTGTHHVQSRSEQIRDEFKKLGQDLQSNNLSQAQQDFTALSQNLSGASQSSSPVSVATGATGVAASATNSLLQQFNQLGQALQSGNLQAAQQDYTAIRQAVQQNAGTTLSSAQPAAGHHHHSHHHHVERSQDSSSASSSSSQEAHSIEQAFGQLAQSLSTGNLQGAQQAYSALQTDLQQIGGFATSAPPSGGSTVSGNLSIRA